MGLKAYVYRKAQAPFVRRLLSELIVPPAYREAHTRGLERFRATGDGPMLGRRIELSAMRHDGSEFPVELAITPMQLGWLAVLFIGVNSGVGYSLWRWALSHAPATQVTVFLSLSPITAAALGVWILGEPMSADALLALACVAPGLGLAPPSVCA